MSNGNIHAKEKSVQDLLGSKYAVDFYQREYKWEEKQIDDLVDDLILTFDENYKSSHEQQDVKQYGQYFLGPIIVDGSEGKRHIVDGQQRLTTLTLALISLLHSVEDENQRILLRNLIYSAHYGKESFNLDVPERTDCLRHILNNPEEQFDTDGKSESVRNLVERYEQMHDRLKESLEESQVDKNRGLLFSTWLIYKVHLVEIIAPSGKEAYRIFETMNDRGLRLAPAEMLKGYLLSEIREKDMRTNANNAWKNRIDDLSNRKVEDAEAIKAWLRARHAKKPADFEDIGSQFHRWVRDNDIGLNAPQKFAEFITRDFEFYTKAYMRVRRAAEKYGAEPGLERIRYLAQHSFTLQYPLLLAPISPGDSPVEITRKLRVIAAYLDILIHRRIGNWKIITERAMRTQIFNLIPEIRSMSAQEIASCLADMLKKDNRGTFASEFALHKTNRPRMRRILARITDYVHVECGGSSRYAEFFAPGKNRYQIEHIWHDNYEKVRKEESMSASDLSRDDFERMRHYIGGLLLLPAKDNASYGAIPYAKKLGYYRDTSATLLSASLHKDYYGKHRPGFEQFRKQSGLPFGHHAQFQKTNLEQRQILYREIADKIWHPDILHKEANAD